MNYFNKHILEAINRGILLALDDYEDIKDNNFISSDIINTNDVIKNCIDFNKQWVDLGLPSGTLWARYNIGCDFNLLSGDPKKTKASDWFGNHYAWGEIETKQEYTNKNYKFYKISSRFNSGIGSWIAETPMIKYNNDDNLLTLLPEDDVATALYGKYAHIPSKKLFDELFFLDYRYVKYKYVKDLYGIMFKGKNGNELFLPAAGDYNQYGYKDNYDCYYWSRDRLQNAEKSAYFYYANNITASINIGYRILGLSIRPVLEKGVN